MTAQLRLLSRSLFVSAVLAASAANAATIQLRAWLNGAQVPLAVPGTGLGIVTYDTVNKVVTWDVSYQNLTSACTNVHFHGPASAGVGTGVAVGMGCSGGANPLTGSSAPLTPTEEAQLLSGQWYINVHTVINGDGEIRGQVVRVASDFGGDGRADLLWRNSSTGENYLYPMNGTTILPTEGYLRTVADQSWQVAAVGDFNGDGHADILWRNKSTGQNYIYMMDGTSIIDEGYVRTVADQNWQVAGVGDFNGDGKADILWRNKATGENYVYPMDGMAILPAEGYLRTVADQNWQVAGVGDFNGDGRVDIVWRNKSSGENYIYLMNGVSISGEGYLRTVADQNWRVAGVADFDGDGRADILWRNVATGENYMYPMAGVAIRSTESYVRTVADLSWQIAAVGDYDGDGQADIFWRNSATGNDYVYLMNGPTIKNEGYTRTVAAMDWKPAAPVPASTVFPLRVEPGKRYLSDASGIPFLMIGESPQAMIGGLSEADAELFLANRKSHGFNTVLVHVLCASPPFTACGADGTTYDGIAPFTVGSDLSTYDLSAPNEAYFARADRIIQLAARYGFLVMLDPAETIKWLSVLQNNGLDKARTYGRYVGTRYKNFANIVWFSGNDFQSWRTNSDDLLVQEVAKGIKETDPNQMHTVLLDYDVSSSLDDPTWAPIISLNAVYTYFPTYAKTLDAYNQSSIPVFLAEANYEGEDNTSKDPSTPEILRRQQYWTLLSGATGHLYGNRYTWGFGDEAWRNQLDSPGAVQMAYLKALFAPRAWYELVPEVTAATQPHTIVTAGSGTFSSGGSIGANDYVTAARTPSGKLVMAYVPSLRTITVDMTKLSGLTSARWYDPAAGTFTSIAGSPFPNTGSRNFATPGSNADGDGDWVLVLEAQ